MLEPNITDKDQEIVDVTREYFNEADSAMAPIRRVWDTAWALFNQQYDFSSKETWQHRVPIPKIAGAVRTTVALFKQAILRSADWFAVNTPVSNLKPYIPMVTGMIKYWLERIDFVNIFAEGIHGGLLSSLVILKVYWVKGKKVLENSPRSNQVLHSSPLAVLAEDEVKYKFSMSGFLGEEAPQREGYELDGNLVVYAVDPYKFRIDPTGRNKYVMEDITVDYDDLLATAKDKGYEEGIIKKIEEDFKPKSPEDIEEARRKGHSISENKPSFRKTVVIRECWGDILNKEGKRIHTNVTWSVANEKYLIRKPVKNPFWHQKYPYAWGPIIRKPFSVWHKGFTEDLHGIQMAITELTNAILDSNLVATLRAFELDVDMVADPEQFKNGIWPGKVYKKHGALAGQSQMIRELEIGAFVPQSIRILMELDRTFQNESVVTEFVTGGMGARGRATATEVVSKTNQASTLIQDIAVDIENFILGPVLSMMFCVCAQYQRNFNDDRFTGFVKEELLNRVIMLTDEERKEFINDKFIIKVSGVSGYINRVSQVQKFQILSQVFQYAPELIQWFRKKKLLSNVLEWLNWDPEDLLYSEEEMKLQQQQAQPQQQQQAPAPNPAQNGGLPPQVAELMRSLGG